MYIDGLTIDELDSMAISHLDGLTILDESTPEPSPSPEPEPEPSPEPEPEPSPEPEQIRGITTRLVLEVMGKDRVVIPGCEPTSTITSDVLLRFQRCCGATVSLAKALEAIPGSSVEFQINSGIFAGYRKRVFVLPATDLNCGCDPKTDYYQILRDLACQAEDEPEDLEGCEPQDMGYCPIPGQEMPAPVYPYIDEGSNQYGDVADFSSTWPYNVVLH